MLPLFFIMAMETSVLINEIAWMGDSNNWRNEWIELYNPNQYSINLDNWALMIDDTKTVLSGVIDSNSFFVISKNKEMEHDNVLKGSLKNTGNCLTLLDLSNNIVDKQDFSLGWQTGDNQTKRTMERQGNDWQTSSLPNGTPGKKNSLLEAKNVVLSDIEINKDGIKNPSSFFKVLLSGVAISSFISIFSLYLNLKPKKHSIKN